MTGLTHSENLPCALAGGWKELRPDYATADYHRVGDHRARICWPAIMNLKPEDGGVCVIGETLA